MVYLLLLIRYIMVYIGTLLYLCNYYCTESENIFLNLFSIFYGFLPEKQPIDTMPIHGLRS